MIVWFWMLTYMKRKKTDSEIEQWVLRELGSQQDLGSQEICVQSHEGVVTLRGSVPNDANKLAAEQAVYRVLGIAGVVNDIKVELRCVEMSKSLVIVTLSEQRKPGPLVQRQESRNPTYHT